MNAIKIFGSLENFAANPNQNSCEWTSLKPRSERGVVPGTAAASAFDGPGPSESESSRERVK